MSFITAILWIVAGIICVVLSAYFFSIHQRKTVAKYLKKYNDRLRNMTMWILKHKFWIMVILLSILPVYFLVLLLVNVILPELNYSPPALEPIVPSSPVPTTPPTGLATSTKTILVVGIVIILASLFSKKVRDKSKEAFKLLPKSVLTGPAAAARWSFITVPVHLGKFFWFPKIRYLWITGLLIFAIILLPAMVFFPWGWDNVWGKPVIFWGFTLGLLFVIWFAFAFHDKKWGKWVTLVLAVIVALGLFNKVSQTTTYKEWKKANEASAVASATVSRPMELPWGVLQVKTLGAKEPDLANKMKWEDKEGHVLYARNVYRDGRRFDFDIWTEDGTRKSGEFRWDVKYMPYGNFKLTSPAGNGTWELADAKDTSLDKYKGTIRWVSDGKDFEVPVIFTVETK